MKTAVLSVIATLVVVAVAAGAFYFGRQGVQTPGNGLEKVPTQTPTATPTEAPPIGVESTGTIEGSLSYPSEGIPKDMTVCAENNQTLEKYCTGEHLKNSKYTYGLGYKLEVPAGSYLIYAQVPNFGDGYRAYYSEFVTCGLNVNCLSHKPIEVTVSAGETVDSVDPQDWYNQQP